METESFFYYTGFRIQIQGEYNMFKKIFTTAMIAGLCFTASPEKGEAATYHIKAINVAKSNLGVPYKYGGISPTGFDCSGLIKYAYAKAGKTLPRTAAEMQKKGKTVTAYQSGDLLFYAPNKASKATHVGMYVSGGNVINASSSKGVSYFKTNNSYWKPQFIGAKRI